MTVGSNPEIVACPGCDLLQSIPPLRSRTRATCPRCGELLAAGPSPAPGRALALTVAAAITYVVAHSAPLLGLTAVGRTASTTIVGGAGQMWRDGYPGTAVLVAFCSVVAPAIYIAFMLTVLLSLRRPPAPRFTGSLLRIAEALRPWSMSEVMLLGILVALIKIAQIATVVPGVGLYAVFVLMILLAAIPSALDPRRMWDDIEWVDRDMQRARRVGS